LPAEYESSSPAVASPGQLIEPGERAGVFRIGGELLTDADGSSRVTIPGLRGGHRRPAREPGRALPADHHGLLTGGPGRWVGQDMSAVAPPVDA